MSEKTKCGMMRLIEYSHFVNSMTGCLLHETFLMCIFDQCRMTFDLAALDLIIHDLTQDPHPAIEVFLVTTHG
jgi:hypothetical protein